MKMEAFITKKEISDKQYEQVQWMEESGVSLEELHEVRRRLQESMEGEPISVIKAKTFELVLEKGQIAIDRDDIFQDKLNARSVMQEQRDEWSEKYYKTIGKADRELISEADAAGAYVAHEDFGHVSVNTKRLLEIGLGGIYEHLTTAEAAHSELTDKQAAFYLAGKTTIRAFQSFVLRLAEAVKDINADNYACLKNIAEKKPENIYEALQLIVIHFHLHEFIAGARVRTLGRLDQMLYPFYVRDIENGTFTKDEIKEILKYFLNKLWAMKVPFDLPFQLGGIDMDGNEVTNELSYLIVETYMELDIYSPKIHIRVSDKTPAEFIKLVLCSIREGKSSFVFGNDNVIMEALRKIGISERDARDYVFIGCYEPAVYAHEIGCTGNGNINAAKMVEFVVTGGKDLKTGKQIGIDTGRITSYEEFLAAVKAQMKYAVDNCIRCISNVEKHYGEMYPDPLLSAMLEECVDSGTDAYESGARYNNTSLYMHFLASLVDSVTAVKRLVFEDKLLTFDELCQVLKNNWEDHEKLRLKALKLPEKYGNNNALADKITQDFSAYFAELVTGRPNGRGGVFKASNFSIDAYVRQGEKTMATPDGRLAGDVLSKNLSPTTGMDKNGITALIESVTKIDFTNYPNGSVLDVILHPSAVQGEDGLAAMYGLLRTFFLKGGIAMHGNVFNAETLKEAQKDPKKYATLQVRVCGWNAYFVNLSKEEQDDFIKKAENMN